MATASDIASQIRATLLATDPELDTSVGTTTRKIIDAVSEQISEAYVDNHLLAYQYDINSKTGSDLDTFCAQFGISRFGAKRATGYVTFTRSAANAKEIVFIVVNTMVGNPGSINTEVMTVSPAIMQVGQTSVSIPVVAVQGGPQGNIGSGQLTQILTPLPTYLNASNIEPLAGGTDQETDDQLRLRWKQTVFRSMAGTEQMYLGIALDDGQAHIDSTGVGEGCYAANVVGSSKRFREQVQIDAGIAVSSITDATYVYGLSPVLGPDIDSGLILIRNQDYLFDTSVNPPQVTMLVGTYWDGSLELDGSHHMVTVDQAIFDLEFDYAPSSSRNDPANGIENRIDVWCAGRRPQDATQSIVFNNTNLFTGVTGTVFYNNYYFRDSGNPPTAGNTFIPLAFGPIITIPGTITIGGTTYVKDTDYWLVHQDFPFGLSPTSYFGLEWHSTHLPTTGAVFSIDYTYNEVPADVQASIDNWRLLGTDALAHQAKEISLRFNLAIMYDRGADRTTVNAGIRTAISQFLTSIGFNGVVQVSDVLNKIHQVPGVDNVRFLNGSDFPTYDPATPELFMVGIQEVVNGVQVRAYVDRITPSYDSPLGRAVDVEFGDAEIPVFDNIWGGGTDTNGLLIPMAKAQNKWGVSG